MLYVAFVILPIFFTCHLVDLVNQPWLRAGFHMRDLFERPKYHIAASSTVVFVILKENHTPQVYFDEFQLI